LAPSAARLASGPSVAACAWLLIVLCVLVSAVAGADDLTPERLTAREWRAFSDVFPALPSDGHPIRLRPQGTVETATLARVTQWTLNAGGELELREKDGESVWVLRWFPAQGLLVSCAGPPHAAMPPLVLAPPGSTTTSVGESLRALGLTRCGPRPRAGLQDVVWPSMWGRPSHVS
jgi:hypothetical protein